MSKMASPVTNSINEFSLKLYHKMVTKDQNFFISPYSISTALQMCYVGARENTAKQLAELLCLSSNDPSDLKVLEKTQKLNKAINQDLKSDGISISAANKIYQMINFEVKKEFLDKMVKYFETTLEQVDFGNSVAAAKKINDWVEQKTNNKIKDLVNPNCLDQLTRMVLVNAIYFKGTWDQKFKKENTQKQQFQLSASGPAVVQVDMMKLLGKRFHLKINPAGLNCAVCELPYIGRKLSMTIILPNKGVEMAEIEQKLTAQTLHGLLENNGGTQLVNIHLPKFKFTNNLELSNQLIQLGAADAFSQKLANFNEINQRPQDELCISKVIHQAFVEVNEEGTEAAAATAVVMARLTSVRREEPPYEFVCDRPFIFTINENESKTILFMGKCVNPNT